MNGKKHFIKKIFQTMNWLWIQNGMKSSHKILNKFTENWFLFAKNLCIFCNDLWYVDYIGRTRYNFVFSTRLPIRQLTEKSSLSWNICLKSDWPAQFEGLIICTCITILLDQKIIWHDFDTLFGWYTKFLSFYFSGLPTNKKFE